jgi:hypothetical protein
MALGIRTITRCIVGIGLNRRNQMGLPYVYFEE